MSEDVETHILYSDDNFASLMKQYQSLNTIEASNSWDQRAQTEIEVIVQAIRELDQEINVQSAKLEQIKQEHSQKSFLKRTFSTRNAETDAATLIEKYRKFRETLEALASRLQEAIDFTPNSSEEQKALLKELRFRKKELQAQKRETVANMKSIREEARVKSVNAGKGFLGMYNSRLASSQRRDIRYSREAALGPHEDAKQAIERQILQVEKDILWVERIK